MTAKLKWSWDDNGFTVQDDNDQSRSRCFLLKDILFRHHRDSYFGTLIHTKSVKESYKLFIPAFQAVTYFATEREQDSLFIWDGPYERSWLTEVARFFLQALVNGWYEPDFTAWKVGRWQMLLQPVAESVPVYERLVSEGDGRLLNLWFGALFHDLNEDPNIAPHWQKLENHFSLFPNTQSRKSHRNSLFETIRDEQDWLAAIGWSGERLSVSFGLQLIEPLEDGEWHLIPVVRPFLQTEWASFIDFLSGETMDTMAEQRESLMSRFRKMHEHWKSFIPPLLDTAADLNGYTLNDDEAWQFLSDWSARLLDIGVVVLTPDWWETKARRAPRLMGNMSSDNPSQPESKFGLQQLVRFDWRIALEEGVELSEDEFYKLVDQKKRWVRINGRWIVMNQEWVTRIREWLDTHRQQGGMTLAEVMRAFSEEQQLSDGVRAETQSIQTDEIGHSLFLNDEYRQYFAGLFDRQIIPVKMQPKPFVGTLYHYQQFGFSWLLYLRQLGFGACLADDMGLGKTIQLIGYLLELQEQKLHKPSLLVCPFSVLGNWQHELSVFAPSLKVAVHHGLERRRGARFTEEMAEMDIVLTTYSLISPDFAEFDSIEWDLLCIDEAQNIKNPNVKQSKAVRRLRSTHRIAMTGTPIENNLNELWSIYDFINPNYLGTLPFFRTQYVSHSDKNAQDEVRSRLRAIIYPFLLRRVKKDPQVMLALPEKHEVKVFVQLTAEQTVLYENEREQLLEQSSSGQKQLQMGAVLKAITRYKQICNHPLLIERPQMLGRESVAEQSNKLLRLLEMIEEIHERGERALVFTQYVEMGKIIVRELKRRFLARDILFFDGSATGKQRQQMISDFQKQDSHIPVMVLTIRSGGVGINLTAANHVFHYDRWWNPAVENQATDRTYRIGQTKDVTVYKLITVGTIEEKIDSLLSEKKELSDFMLLNDDDDIMRKLTVTDWERLLL